MRVFVGEFLCGGGMASTPKDQIPCSLLSEGLAMWRAMITDFAEWAEVVTPIDPRLNLSFDRMRDSVRCVPLRSGENVRGQWLAIAKTCDIALVVAPEIDDELGQMVQAFREAGPDLLSADQATLRMASDKWLSAKWLVENDIPTPLAWSSESRLAANGIRPSELGIIGLNAKRWVRKPRDGCGSDSVLVFHDLQAACSTMANGDLVQAWVEGRPASMLVVGGTTKEVADQVICPAVWQHCRLDEDDSDSANRSDVWKACYTGGSGPIESELQSRVVSLAEQVTRALPEPLRGFLGIDVVLGDRIEDDCVIEINPRLTTSYIGIRQMLDKNLTSIWNPESSCERWIAGGQLRVGPRQVCWTSEGDVQIESSRDGES
ncbi:ATP-grasp domain-containing protein [Rhodopirellula europaea]|uniref:Protein containing ATP-grasp fold, DUF201-type n=1 Tax=Rhodopirellula europaea 6C TaxID=1263867 RepID=M2AVS1_9BACT|nr:ATP-grasp domain-containing protein [Rhodopirellula europaea]EMB16807.1 protein containing ATP-grasp fold, DUF201-type [Rhodopirellula europaea 6C]